MIENNR